MQHRDKNDTNVCILLYTLSCCIRFRGLFFDSVWYVWSVNVVFEPRSSPDNWSLVLLKLVIWRSCLPNSGTRLVSPHTELSDWCNMSCYFPFLRCWWWERAVIVSAVISSSLWWVLALTASWKPNIILYKNGLFKKHDLFPGMFPLFIYTTALLNSQMWLVYIQCTGLY